MGHRLARLAPLLLWFASACGDNLESGDGLVVSPQLGLRTTEAGGQATFTVALTAAPSHDVVVTLDSTNTGEGVVTPSTLTFQPNSYNVAQLVTITGVDDARADGDQAYAVHVVTDTLGSYEVTVTNGDDDVAGIRVTPLAGLVTSESGMQATFTVELTSQPTADVTLALASSDPSEGTPDVESLLFTPASWGPQTVTVTGVADAEADGDVAYAIALAPATSSDPQYSGLDGDDVQLVNIEGITNAAITVTPTSGLVVSEAGTTATFTVVLAAQPAADVTIPVMTSDATEASVSTTELVFTPTDWNVAQTVTVTGVDDALDDGDVAWTIVLGAATSSDAAFAGLDPADVTGTTTDNDGPGVTVTPTSGLVVSEHGTTATFSVVLQAQPSATVVISLASSDVTEATVSPSSLSFTTADWNVAQTVTVTGVDDALDDGDVAWTIELGPVASADAGYASLDPPDVSGTTVDDDGAGVTVTPTSGLVVSEVGTIATFTVVLQGQPAANVTIPVMSSDTTEATVSPSALEFTPGTWNVAQTVTVTGVDDALDDGNVAWTVVLAPATSTDPAYDGLDPMNVTGTTLDNDTAGITVTPTTGLTTSESGGTATFTVQLTSQPTANVTIPLASSNTDEGTVSASSLVFMPGTWNMTQTVTITGVDDALADGAQAYTIVLGAATSSDATYDGVDPADVAVTNLDDEVSADFVFTQTDLVVSEYQDADELYVALARAPTADVTISFASSDVTEGTVHPASLTFTPQNWATPQSVAVTGVDDALHDGPITFSIITSPAVSADATYDGLNPPELQVINLDNDMRAVEVNANGNLRTSEAGGTVSFRVRLPVAPTAPVTCTLFSSDLTEGTVNPTTLTFTPASYGYQTVTVTGVDDAVDDGDVTYTIVLNPCTSADFAYNGSNPANVILQNRDND